MEAMEAGKLRHRVNIKSTSTSQDSWGEPVDQSTSLVAAVWASVEPLNGQELIRAQQLDSDITHRVTIRHRSDVIPGMKIIHKSRTLSILSVIDRDERGISLECMCKEVVQ